MSFQNATKLDAKAEKIFGVVDGSSSFTVQREGFMLKKAFGKGGNRGRWQKRYFVLKDSFLFWYKTPPKNSFDLHPLGCLPLGGCGVFPHGLAKDSEFCFEVTHEDFKGKRLLLKTDSRETADDWMQVLGECRNATWENAILGNAQLEKLRYQGTALEKKMKKEHEAAVEAALAVEKTRREREEVQQQKNEAERRAKEELSEKQKLASELEATVEQTERKILEEEQAINENLEKIAEAERQLRECEVAMKSLDEALARRDAAKNKSRQEIEQNEEMRANAAIIRSFFTGSSDKRQSKRSSKSSRRVSKQLSSKGNIVTSLNDVSDRSLNSSAALEDTKADKRKSKFFSRISFRRAPSINSVRASMRLSMRKPEKQG